MTTDRADYCMLVNVWAWSSSQVHLLRLEVGAWVQFWSLSLDRNGALWCIRGMYTYAKSSLK